MGATRSLRWEPDLRVPVMEGLHLQKHTFYHLLMYCIGLQKSTRSLGGTFEALQKLYQECGTIPLAITEAL